MVDTSAARSEPRTIIAVDMLRFACALLVLVRHLGTGFILPPAVAGQAPLIVAVPAGLLGALGRYGWIGVEIFFVISGIVIARSAVGVAAGSFFRRRALRLVPAAWICASITACVVALLRAPAGNWVGWAASIGFVPLVRQIDPVYWTLSVEIVFYVLIGSVLGRAGSRAAIDRRATLIGLASVGWWAAIAAGAIDPLLAEHPAMMLTLLPHGCFFALGCLMSSILQRGAAGRDRLWLGVLCVACLCQIWSYTRLHDSSGAAVFPVLIFAAAMLVLATMERLQAPLGALVSAGWARRIGLMTFPLYLLHHAAGGECIAFLMRQGWGYWPAAAVVVPVVLMVAALVTGWSEPMLRRGLAALTDPSLPRLFFWLPGKAAALPGSGRWLRR